MTPPISDEDKVVLDGPAIEAEGLADWRVLLGVLHARFETGGFNAGVTLVQAIAAAADEMDHHPDVDLTYPRVDVRLSSHDVGGVTRRDVIMARAISEFAAKLGATSHPGGTSALELGLDTPDAAEIAPFWAAVLDYREQGPVLELVDPYGRGPTIWFQESEPHETPHQRWHLDLRIPPEVVEARIAASIEAGGTLVADDEAPRFWVLADPQGNQACLTTWQGRTHA
ncbi:VOC family protein [soil metagenome]